MVKELNVWCRERRLVDGTKDKERIEETGQQSGV